jgi:hypothetical protein
MMTTTETVDTLAAPKKHARETRQAERCNRLYQHITQHGGNDSAEDDRPEVPRAVYTINEFCRAHRISPAMYFKLRSAGLGPREMRAMRKITISVEAAAAWRREREDSR